MSVAARYAYPGAMLSLLQEEVDLHYWDYQARVDHPLGPGRLSVLALGSYDSLTVTDRACGGIAAASPVRPGRMAEPRRTRTRSRSPSTGWTCAGGRRWAGGRLLAALGAGYDRTSAPYDNNGDLTVSGKSLLPRVVYDRAFGWPRRGSPPTLLLTVGADGELTDYDALAASIDPDRALGALRARSAILLGAHAGLTWRAERTFRRQPGRAGRFLPGERRRTPSTCSRACTCATASASSCG